MKRYILFLLAVMSITPVCAIEYDLYGDIFLGIWWEQRERWYNDTNVTIIDTTHNATPGPDTSYVMGADSFPVYQNSWEPYGKFGMNLKQEKLSGCIEFGISKNIYDAALSGVTGLHILKREDVFLYMRKWYGMIRFNDHLSLRIGQDDAIVNHAISDQAFYDHNSMVNLGCTYTGRRPMVRLDVDGKVDELLTLKGKLACIRPDTVVIGFKGNELETEVETVLPKFEVGGSVNYESDLIGGKATITGGFERYSSILRTDPSMLKDSIRNRIDCYVASFDIGFRIGPVRLEGTCSKSRNPGAYGIASGNRWEWRGSGTDPKTKDIFLPFHEVVIDSNGKTTGKYIFHNASMLQYAIVGKVKPADFLYFEAGYGRQEVDHTYQPFVDLWDDRDVWYVQSTITFFKNFEITPELGIFRWGKLYRQGGRFAYCGLSAHFHFPSSSDTRTD